MLSIFVRSTVVLSVGFLISACGGGKSASKSGDNDSGNNKAGVNYTLLSGDIKNENGNLVGSGKLIFKDSLGGVDSDKGFELSFALKEEGASVTLHAFADKQLNSGINFQFKREAGKIKGSVDGSRIPVEVSADGEVSVNMDAHNSENPTHVIVEAGDSDHNGKASKQGGDNFWGLTLENASVSNAKAVAPKHSH